MLLLLSSRNTLDRSALMPRSRRLVVGALLLSMGGWPALVSAQPASLRLLVVDDETGDPVEGAMVRLKGRRDTVTNTHGRVELLDLEPGTWKLELRALGFEPRSETIALLPGKTLDLRFGLAFTGEKLADVVVEARAAKLAPRYADFHRRMDTGLGFFMTWQTIKQRGYTSLGESLRGVRGVRVDCRVTDCSISMSRSRGCAPSFWVDGIEGAAFVTSMAIRDVYGMEVYRGAGETPGEYAGTGGCGAIVIWTKNKPFR